MALDQRYVRCPELSLWLESLYTWSCSCGRQTLAHWNSDASREAVELSGKSLGLDLWPALNGEYVETVHEAPV